MHKHRNAISVFPRSLPHQRKVKRAAFS
jgi:hypothetical protein